LHEKNWKERRVRAKILFFLSEPSTKNSTNMAAKTLNYREPIGFSIYETMVSDSKSVAESESGLRFTLATQLAKIQ
jgi:hypothetical protein